MTARVVALVLAAGLSTRFAGDKLIHPYRDKPLAAHIADVIAEMPVSYSFAVCPIANEARKRVFRERGFEIVDNDNPGAGLSTSLILGAERAMDLDANVLLVCLADMPHVTAGYLAMLIAELDGGAAIVASQSDVARTPPVAIARRALEQLRALEGDSGARPLLAAARAVRMPVNFSGDFDTREDFTRG